MSLGGESSYSLVSGQLADYDPMRRFTNPYEVCGATPRYLY
jgi:hypothetical protein